MTIQWFPGHMHLTRQAIRDRMKAGIDVVVELLDARCPGSSSNPLLHQLTKHKPALKLLNKQDLADPVRTAEWLAHFNAQPHTRAQGLEAKRFSAKNLLAACRELAPTRTSAVKPLRLLICGIPNVGKSTLINALMGGRRATKTGDEPGVTKVEQKLMLGHDCLIYDTPGMLWPKIAAPECGWNLAASGAVGRNALDEELVALELIERLQAGYPEALQARYALAAPPEANAEERLALLAKKRGAVLAGGRPNLQKAAEILIHEFRQGLLGRITLETPEQFAAWSAAALAPAEEEDEAQPGQEAD
ncbi:MAG: ribosome biogenesis GTPase YlqF [Burkholderiales bacterium]|nr:ribosome biogenesis GTPase YlqF [Burkholderiales bacterium]